MRPLVRGAMLWRRSSDSDSCDTDAAMAGDPAPPVPPTTTAPVGLIRPMVLRNIDTSLPEGLGTVDLGLSGHPSRRCEVSVVGRSPVVPPVGKERGVDFNTISTWWYDKY